MERVRAAREDPDQLIIWIQKAQIASELGVLQPQASPVRWAVKAAFCFPWAVRDFGNSVARRPRPPDKPSRFTTLKGFADFVFTSPSEAFESPDMCSLRRSTPRF